MDDAELLRRELRAAREELVRKRSRHDDSPLPESGSVLPLMPDRNDEFLRLALMSVEELETHVERLERDLEDLDRDVDDLVD
jgi:outer membrane murein-binding lipoprotein Lpp